MDGNEVSKLYQQINCSKESGNAGNWVTEQLTNCNIFKELGKAGNEVNKFDPHSKRLKFGCKAG